MYRVSMKKIVCFLLVAIIFSSLCVFASNLQRIIPLNDDSYEKLDNLFITLGMAIPSTSRPWSEEEFLLNLNKIDRNVLSKTQKEVYVELYEQYVENNNAKKSFDAKIDTSLEAYIHTNNMYETTNDWLYDYDTRKPLLDLSMGLSPASSLYAQMDLTFKATKFTSATSETTGEQGWFKKKISSTLFMLDSTNYGSPDGNIPYRAYLSFGNANWNLELGRERLSWGAGATGNLIIGKQLQYHNLLKLTTFNNNIKVTLLASFFPHPNEIYAGYDYTGNNHSTYSQSSAPDATGLKMFLGHMLEFFLLDNKLSLTISENIMYQSNTANLDLRYFSPMMIFHNFYNPKNMNSILGIETVWAPIKNLNVYLQFALDDISLSVESTNKPNAIGLIGGAKWVQLNEFGRMSATLEGAYTSPYMYLRSKEAKTSQANIADTLDFIVAIRRWFSGDSDNVLYDSEYLGYKYGNDSIVAYFDFVYDNLQGLAVNANIFFMAHGEKNMYSWWKMGDSLEPNASKTPFGNIEYTFITGLGAQYSFKSGTTVAIQTALLNTTSKGTDFQLTVSATQHIL